jgi:hypothetical protein
MKAQYCLGSKLLCSKRMLLATDMKRHIISDDCDTTGRESIADD